MDIISVRPEGSESSFKLGEECLEWVAEHNSVYFFPHSKDANENEIVLYDQSRADDFCSNKN